MKRFFAVLLAAFAVALVVAEQNEQVSLTERQK